MAQRSSGIFPREGFNLDAETEITTSAAPAAVTLAHAKTIRVIVIGLAGGTATVTIGGQEVVIDAATDLDPNGVGIAHVRGALCSDNNVSYATTGTVAGCFYELVDGPRR